MQQLERLSEHSLQHPEHTICCSRVFFCVVNTVFCKLHIPVAELIPDEIIDFLHRDPQLELIHVLGDILRQCVHLGQDPAVSRCEQLLIRSFDHIFLHIHKDKS